MNANSIGKGLVFVHLAASLLGMTWAAALYFQQRDWGWKEPAKEFSSQEGSKEQPKPVYKRVPSEIDKRAAALSEAYKALATVLPDLKPAQTALREAEERIGPNHLFYAGEIDRLRGDPKPIQVKQVKFANGQVVLDKIPIGQPILEKEVPEITKSLAAYLEELDKKRGEIKQVVELIHKRLAEEKELTLKLTGIKDDLGLLAVLGFTAKQGDVIRPGLYAMQEMERDLQEQIRFEKTYIRPIWVRTLEEAQAYEERRADLEATLEQMRKARLKK